MKDTDAVRAQIERMRQLGDALDVVRAHAIIRQRVSIRSAAPAEAAGFGLLTAPPARLREAGVAVAPSADEPTWCGSPTTTGFSSKLA